MKKGALLCSMLLALTASSVAAAPGVNLRWVECFGDTGVPNRSFACNVNTGSNLLVASFELGADLPQASGLEIVIDLATAATPLPDWWQIQNAGTCRVGSLSAMGVPPAEALLCTDWSGGLSTAAVAAYRVGLLGPNTARILEVSAVPSNQLQDLTGGLEYFAISTRITNQKTVGTGSCSGCSSPACIVLRGIKVVTPPVAGQPSRDVSLSGATDPAATSDFVTWQGGAGVVVGGRTGCPQVIPTRRQTWSAVKGLYR